MSIFSPALSRPLILALSILAMLAAFEPARGQEVITLRLATGLPGGTYFALGGALANVLSRPPGSRDCDRGGNCGVEGVVVVAVSSEGSLNSMDMLADGRVDLALVQADIAYRRYAGAVTAATDRQLGVSAIASLYSEAMHVIVHRDSPFQSIQDLAGRQLAIGGPQSGTRAIATWLLEHNGIGPDAYTAVEDRPGRAADRFFQGEIDAMFLMGGDPIQLVTDLARDVPIRLLPIIATDYVEPFLALTAIGDTSYVGIADLVPTVGVAALLLASDRLPPELAQALTASLWTLSNLELLASDVAVGSQISLNSAFDGVAIPLHPGARRYYLDAGLLKVIGADAVLAVQDTSVSTSE
jgi:TRAP transporter TAXI family solute receptor